MMGIKTLSLVETSIITKLRTKDIGVFSQCAHKLVLSFNFIFYILLYLKFILRGRSLSASRELIFPLLPAEIR